MNKRLRAYLELVRAPNLFTAMADPLAGFLYAGGTSANAHSAAYLCIASAFLYAGGVALNDVCDAEQDRAERPSRPIPSGRIRLSSAAVFAIALLVCGTAIAAVVSVACYLLAAAICITIVAYDLVLKRTRIAPGLMGLCRVLNLAMGMCSVNSVGLHLASAVPWLAIWIYVTALTLFARAETGTIDKRRIVTAGVGLTLSVITLSTLFWIRSDVHPGFLTFNILMLLAIVTTLRNTLRFGDHVIIQRTTGTLVLGIIVLDAAIVCAAGGVAPSLIVGLLIVPTLLLRRSFAMS